MSVIHRAFSPGTQVTQTETAFVHITEGPAYPLPVCLLVKERGQSAMAWWSVAPTLHFHRRLASGPRLKKVRQLIYTLLHTKAIKNTWEATSTSWNCMLVYFQCSEQSSRSHIDSISWTGRIDLALGEMWTFNGKEDVDINTLVYEIFKCFGSQSLRACWWDILCVFATLYNNK